MSGLKEEIAAYKRMRDDLELEHLGKWVVVHDEKLAGIYDSFEVAADNPVQRFGRGPYLIKRAGEPPMIDSELALVLNLPIVDRQKVAGVHGAELEASPISPLSAELSCRILL